MCTESMGPIDPLQNKNTHKFNKQLAPFRFAGTWHIALTFFQKCGFLFRIQYMIEFHANRSQIAQLEMKRG